MTDYPALVGRCRALVAAHTSAEHRTAVVSRGDVALTDVEGRTVVQFPAGADGRWIGYHPADGAQALAMLEGVRGDGATHLLVPATAIWWLDHYAELAEWLASEATLAADDPAAGRLFVLPRPESGETSRPERDAVVVDLAARLDARHREQADHLLDVARATSRSVHPAVAGRGWVEPSWAGLTHLVIPEVLTRLDAAAAWRARAAATPHPVLARRDGLGVVHVLRSSQETTT